jgi:mono/diheme cytochrome c family protein
LRSLPPNARKNQAHELKFPYNLRFLLWGWKLLYFKAEPAYSDAPAATPVERGAYLVNVLSHCGECHTPRNRFGAANRDQFLGGGKAPDGTAVPNLTPTRLKEFSDKDLGEFLTTGTLPDGDVANESMEEVVTNTTSRLTPADLAAMIAYLRSVPPVPEDSE